MCKTDGEYESCETNDFTNMNCCYEWELFVALSCCLLQPARITLPCCSSRQQVQTSKVCSGPLLTPRSLKGIFGTASCWSLIQLVLSKVLACEPLRVILQIIVRNCKPAVDLIESEWKEICVCCLCLDYWYIIFVFRKGRWNGLPLKR